ncbi:MAG: SPFH/Band 7/PHB domain protein [Bifidobacteriaceae bacterium]|nr:SPFH/Band 7/PHB domain protein [Bifidobacteriaceae bacterium]
MGDSIGEMDVQTVVLLVLAVILVIFAFVVIKRAIRIVPQTQAMLVERLGRYQRTMDAGFHLLVPFIDRVRAVVDLREQVVTFPPQPVITSDNLVVSIDTVIYFQVTNPVAAVYEIANYIMGIEQLTVTTLRNVIGSMDLEQTLTSRDQINGQLRGVLDEATGRWGIRVQRVELKAIDPPPSVQDSMEKQMRAERDRRAAILTAEGIKQSQILKAEGEKQAAILTAEGQAQSSILRAQGESRAILQVFDAIHEGDPDPKLLAYQYLQMLPQLSQGPSSQLWIIPAEFTQALGGIGQAFGPVGASPDGSPKEPSPAARALRKLAFGDVALEDPAEALRRAQGAASQATSDATRAGVGTGAPFDEEVEAGLAPNQAESIDLPPVPPLPAPGEGPTSDGPFMDRRRRPYDDQNPIDPPPLGGPYPPRGA